jgi:DsbC/DsbD-like thiol-disulfide interchange protein
MSFYGMPFPGVYVVDDEGVVTEKFFNRHYATRTSAGTIRDSALGKILARHEVPSAQLDAEQVKLSAFLADPDLKLEVTTDLYVRLELADGFHVYGAPLPEGFIATVATLDAPPGIRVGEIAYPPTQAREFKELGVTLNVYEKTADITVPVTLTAEISNWPIADEPTEIEIPISVHYQACSETVCYLPKTASLSLTVPVRSLLMRGASRDP